MKKGLNRDDSFLKKFSTRQPYRADSVGTIDEHLENNQSEVESRSKHLTVLQPDGNIMFYWLCILTLSILYNLWTCIAREAFREIQERNMMVWIGCDIFCDSIYVFDIFVQIRTGYLDKGIMVYNSKKLLMRYVRTKDLVLDLASLIPLDFLQFSIGVHPMLRFPRFLKVYRSFRFLHLLETRTHFPNFFRVANLTHILFLGSHWFASFYYMISEAEDFEGDWSYPKPVGQFATVTRKYLTSLFWSTLTLTTIGDLPPPESNWEYVFVIVSYLIGVFIFATIVGQVGNVITNRNASRQEFERLLDGAKLYMRMHNVPQDVQKRVQRWYDYVWTRGRMKGSDINSLGLLPDKLKTELAIHVNLETLKRVTIFQECQPEFLHDLVLKMKAYIFTPGDLICRQGEVAREMFIIADGLVEIISESGTVLTKMETGDFFGEIGILNLDGGINRRTADVKSVGYSELFVLSREDVLEALKDHPEAERVIREYGQQRLKEIEVHRQKMKFSVSDFQTKWSPNSPARYLRGSPSKQIRVVKSKKAPGVLINNVSKRKSRKKKFLGAMKDLAMKTGYKGGSTHSQDRTEMGQTEQQDCWPVIAKLPQGDVIAIKENHKPRKFSFPTIVEKAMEANKRGLLICEKNKVSDDLAGVTKSVDSSSKQCDLTIKRNAQEGNVGYTNQHPENSVAKDGPNYLLSKRLNQSPTTLNKQSANNSTIR
ncbi:cyclic nucleotide-gated channel rod photoreceptor subunit alpha-like [Saccostrea echinata]|uniref:cyclic nucleotide-gated channel rod photoreceptor subunit alpha-like n=1 Tax=Saccostrea echinata TaxID=191078 RepID=UPI002A7ED170|nr:cyclic nucleotide-gated channel rod photoreceptor subunit alpha-like [Saccostrea echinata]